jgi:2-polyprenyl-3-methyl-5-hydroxy-6-metoxy-1,4-benzoquinol methylase
MELNFMIDRYYKYQTLARGLLTTESLLSEFKRREKWYNSRLKKFLPTGEDISCLDVACGYGNFLYFLKCKGYVNIQGYDLDPEQVRLARLLGLPAHNSDALNFLKTTSETFDVISALDFIEHISKDDASHFLDLCFSKLKPGGVLIIRTPCADGFFGSHDAANDLTHLWTMTSTVLDTVLKMIGFDRVQVLDEKPQPFKIVNVIRLVLYYFSLCFCVLVCLGMGLSIPRIWSKSMWGIGYKPKTLNNCDFM